MAHFAPTHQPSHGAIILRPMARFKILSIADKQRILFQDSPDKAQLTAWGDFYLEQGRTYDALEFYERAEAKEPLRKLVKQGIREGNQFLYRRALQALKDEPRASDLEELASHCNRAGRGGLRQGGPGRARHRASAVRRRGRRRGLISSVRSAGLSTAS